MNKKYFSVAEFKALMLELLTASSVHDGIKLQNLDYFRNYTLDPFTVDWSNEIGFAPEYLYEIGTAA